MCWGPMETEMVVETAVRARQLWGTAPLKRGTLGVARPGLKPGTAFVRDQAMIAQGAPGDRTKVVVGVCGHEVMRPHFLWGEPNSLDDVPQGTWGHGGRREGAGGKLLQGKEGSYEPLFQDPQGVGLFCQAITGAYGLHGTDMGTKNQKNASGMFGISASRWVLKGGHLPPLLQTFLPKNGQNQGP